MFLIRCANLIFFNRTFLLPFSRKNLSTFKDISIGRIFFPMPTSTLYHTDVVMTWQEIVSKFCKGKSFWTPKYLNSHYFAGSFGGLLGLCLGFSLISIVEIAYFATVRLFRNVPTAFTSSPTSDMQSIPKKSDHVFAQKIKRMYASDFYWLDRRKITPNRYWTEKKKFSLYWTIYCRFTDLFQFPKNKKFWFDLLLALCPKNRKYFRLLSLSKFATP